MGAQGACATATLLASCGALLTDTPLPLPPASHSLGGALATLNAALLQSADSPANQVAGEDPQAGWRGPLHLQAGTRWCCCLLLGVLLVLHCCQAILPHAAPPGFPGDRFPGVYTFGSPRVGDESWAAAYERLGLAPITLRCAAAMLCCFHINRVALRGCCLAYFGTRRYHKQLWLSAAGW